MIMSAECEHFLQNKLKISSLGATRHSPRRGKLLSALRATLPEGESYCRRYAPLPEGESYYRLYAPLPEGESCFGTTRLSPRRGKFFAGSEYELTII